MGGIDDGTTRIAPTPCPFCGYAFDAVGTADGSAHAPGAGNAAICLNCAEPMVFGPDGALREPTAGEAGAFASDPDWSELRRQRRRLLRMKRQGFMTHQARHGGIRH